MPFGLKNAGTTYQRLMDKVFRHLIERCIEVYIDDMVVMSDSLEQHIKDLDKLLTVVREYDMRLNLEKCVFGVASRKFLGFMLTHSGKEANPDKCQAIVDMQSLANIKEVQRLVGRMIVLSCFMPKLAERIQPMLRLMKKAQKFVWNEVCEQSFQSLNEYLSFPPVLQKCSRRKPLLVYLTISINAISAAIVQDQKGISDLCILLARPYMMQNCNTKW